MPKSSLFAAALIAAGLFIAPSVGRADDSGPYHSKALSSVELAREIPCSRAKREADGAWRFVGTVIMANGVQLINMTVKSNPENKILDRRCGRH